MLRVVSSTDTYKKNQLADKRAQFESLLSIKRCIFVFVYSMTLIFLYHVHIWPNWLISIVFVKIFSPPFPLKILYKYIFSSFSTILLIRIREIFSVKTEVNPHIGQCQKSLDSTQIFLTRIAWLFWKVVFFTVRKQK